MVPLDFTAKNHTAIQVAMELAQRDRAEVTLVHVVESIEHAEGDEFATFYALLQSKAKRLMKDFVRPLSQAGIAVTENLAIGKPAQEILKQVEANHVDLLVLSSHKVDRSESPRNWGTMSYQLSVLCPCEALLVK
ncbi:MAG: universal stress protein [Aeoliella sp.]